MKKSHNRIISCKFSENETCLEFNRGLNSKIQGENKATFASDDPGYRNLCKIDRWKKKKLTEVKKKGKIDR